MTMLLATVVTPTQVTCITAPQPYARKVRIRLLIDDNYIVETSYLYFLFEDII